MGADRQGRKFGQHQLLVAGVDPGLLAPVGQADVVFHELPAKAVEPREGGVAGNTAHTVLAGEHRVGLGQLGDAQ